MNDVSQEAMIYVGPTSSKLGLQKFQIYSQLHENVIDTLADNPALGVLLRPLSDWPKIRDEVTSGIAGSVTHAAEQLIKDGVL